jgi:exodeoxyribonuclease VII large subunit
MDKNIIRLSDLAKEISEVFRKNFSMERYWVSAEILGLKINKGHCYLQLGEKDERSNQPKAEFKAMIWSSNFNLIHSRFIAETGNQLQENMEILCKVEVQFHERFGMSLIVHDVDAAYTLGKMAIERKKTVDKLKQEGVYFLNKQKEVSAVIQTIAVISSADADGFKDFTTKLNDNKFGLVFHTKLFPSLMQGDNAPRDIIAALTIIKQHACFPFLDAVVIVRGGGQTSSLSCYNDYSLAYEVANYPLPVLTGIGHTADVSVVDEVANMNLITPTAVADFIIQHTNTFKEQIDYLRDGIHAYANLCIESEEEAVADLMNAILSIVNETMEDEKSFFDNLASVITQTVNQELVSENSQLNYAKDKIRFLTESIITKELSQLSFDSSMLKNKSAAVLKQEENYLINAQQKSLILDPVNILKRGFSYTLYNNKPIYDANEVPLEAEIETVLYKGSIKSKKIK